MSDELINKYRPKTFAEVIGQDAVVKSMENAVKKKLGRVFLLTGPSGTGKTTLARIAAKALGCAASDIQSEDAATNTGIENMRGIMDGLMYRPLGEGASKAIIIDECHALSKQAVQSLLLTLEEPPSWVYFFLCTTEPDKVIKAVKTRCLAFQLKEVRTKDLFDLLKDTDEGRDMDDAILDLCVSEAEGSPRQALSNLGAVMAAEDEDEAAELLHSAAKAPAAFDLARALLKGSDWRELRAILSRLKETSPESVRHVVRAYMTTVMLSEKTKDYRDAYDILEEFSKPFNSFDGMSPLALACARLVEKGR
jgi:DNA polymerase III gamma/tau subunit